MPRGGGVAGVGMAGRVLAVVCAAPLGIAVSAALQQFVVPGRWTVLGAAAVTTAVAGAALRPLVVRARPDAALLAGAVGLLAPAAATAWATGRLLGASPAARLAWMLGEEDNAHVVGVARELLDTGPSGAELAAQYGTSFATPGVALLRSGLAGAATGDARLDAITATTGAAVLLPVLLGVALVLAAVALRAAGAPAPRPGPTVGGATRVLGALVGAALLGGTVQLVAVALPMQLGFATLAWALAWVVVGWAALLGTHVPGPPVGMRAVLVVQVALAAVLLEGAWPFLVGALILPVLIRLAVPALAALRRGAAGRGPAVRRAVVGTLVVTAGVGAVLTGSGAFRTVLGFGRTAFTAGVEVGGSIIEVGPALRAAAGLAVVLVVLGMRRRPWLTAAVVAAPAGVAVSFGLVWAAATVVADGITGYGGSKLLLALVVLAAAAGAAIVAAGVRPLTGAVAAGLVAALVLIDPLGRTAPDWWTRTSPAEPPHAVATITALESSSPDLPIRCRPAPGTPATPTSRLAAYFCIVWMEDAFNTGPGSGNRFAFFEAEGPTFDETVRAAEAEGLYGFVYPLRLGPGWYGWDGVS